MGQQLRDTRRAGIATRRNSLHVSHRSRLDGTSVEDPVPSWSCFQIRVRIVALLRYHIEMRHRHHDNFVRLRNDVKGIKSLSMSWMTAGATLKMTETELTSRHSVRTVTHINMVWWWCGLVWCGVVWCGGGGGGAD